MILLMRKLALLMVGALVFLGIPVRAQETPQWEIFGGVSYAYANAGNPIVIPAFAFGFVPTSNYAISLHQSGEGWHGQIVENVTSWFGGVADFSGIYAGRDFDLRPFALNATAHADFNAYSYLFGPRFSLRRINRTTVFGEVLVGGVHAAATAAPLQAVDPVVAAELGFPVHENSWAFSGGGGVDFTIRPHLAARVQADYIRSHFPQTIDRNFQNNLRVSAGLVLRLGHK